MLPDNWLQKTISNPDKAKKYLWNHGIGPFAWAERARKFNQQYHSRFGRRDYNPRGIDLLNSDWDQCLVLDACRYDMFEDQHNIDGSLSKVQSQVSSTVELVKSVFTGDHHDIVYVTANPMLARCRDDSDVSFHDEIHVWDDEGWDETYQTVLPETMAEHTLQALEEYPNKRLLVHFIQPHYPFLTDYTEFDKTRPDYDADTAMFWDQIRRGNLNIDSDDVWPPYRATLDAVLPVVDELLEEIPGKTVVTADHGNNVGERSFPIPIREWGHPESVYTNELVDVPWFVSHNGERRNIEADKPKMSTTADEDTIEDRLQALGYR